MTSYIPAHPGGKKILAGAGKESTEMFYKFHANLKINNTPLRYKVIGTLVDKMEDQTWTGNE